MMVKKLFLYVYIASRVKLRNKYVERCTVCTYWLVSIDGGPSAHQYKAIDDWRDSLKGQLKNTDHVTYCYRVRMALPWMVIDGQRTIGQWKNQLIRSVRGFWRFQESFFDLTREILVFHCKKFVKKFIVNYFFR